MRIDPALRALRSDPAPQRAAQEKLAEARDSWRSREEWQPLSRAFEAYGEGAKLAECEALDALFRDDGAARAVADEFVAHFLPVAAEAHWGQFPLRYSVNGSVSTLLLASSGRAALLLLAVDGAALARRARAEAAGFVAGERHEVVLAGSARARHVTCRPVSDKRAEIACSDLLLEPGDRVHCVTEREAVLVEEVLGGTFLTLRLQRRGEGTLTAHDYSLLDGSLVHQSAGDAEQSRLELMMSLLARMGRKDAAPLLAAQARMGPPNLRWQALRECLSLDTEQGFRALSSIARDANDPLAAHAGAVRAQLLEAHPVLARIDEKDLACP
jgi:hypothetical protein